LALRVLGGLTRRSDEPGNPTTFWHGPLRMSVSRGRAARRPGGRASSSLVPCLCGSLHDLSRLRSRARLLLAALPAPRPPPVGAGRATSPSAESRGAPRSSRPAARVSPTSAR